MEEDLGLKWMTFISFINRSTMLKLEMSFFAAVISWKRPSLSSFVNAFSSFETTWMSFWVVFDGFLRHEVSMMMAAVLVEFCDHLYNK